MVIVRLEGGLGNQLFQYAIGRRLAVERHTRLKLDVSEYIRDKRRRYHLGLFNIDADIATPEDVASFHSVPTGVARYVGKKRKIIVEQRPFCFEPAVVHARGHLLLNGYWQNEKYFQPVQSLLRQELTLRDSVSAESRALASLMHDTTAVAVHVRRGDYVRDQHTAELHGACGEDYYRHCVAILAEKCGPVTLFVFSDDPEWVRDHLRFPFPLHISPNPPDRDYEDLWLMTQCRHFIIANSTFSWWGAWLATSPGKIVLAPQRWLAVDDYDTTDLLPSGWISI